METIEKLEPKLGYQDKASLVMSNNEFIDKINELIDRINELNQRIDNIHFPSNNPI